MESNKYEDKYMPLLEHIKELRNRVILSLFIFIIILSICLIYVKEISIILKEPALGIKFLQLAPGEYLFVSVKIATYIAIFTSSPFILYQIIQFTSPGLTHNENKYLTRISISSLCLFLFGTIFSYKTLIPITLSFFIKYGSEVIEPVWSFNEYFNFISFTILTTGFCFQLPILQIILGVTNVLNWKQMIKNWKYIAFISTIFSAIITPSTDPITQLFMTTTILVLYFSGIFILKTIETSKR
uniref:Sec-independent protein translocase component TatC n=1 Tax=Polysiphonia infestans TaxID=2006978 RepID=A0A1Z1MEH1_9FLOR|nr:Sec-independent protein translocase component TatC [Polysiphonia infestans]ARW64373.1 Sec-independent protein translocase component TatC [Polysiphonia infestans]